MTPDQSALLSAALRHARDAEALLAASPDQAWHLAGFGPECARKACLSERWADKAVGHDWTSSAEALLEVAISMDARAARLDLAGWAQRAPLLARWRPEHRYNRTGANVADAAGLVEGCAGLVARVHADLWMDGALQGVEG